MALVVLGDDNIYSVHPDYIDKFTEDFLASSMAKFGAEYTSEDKTTKRVGLRRVEECTLLKRGFVYSETAGRTIAPADLFVVLETCMWTKKKRPLQIAISNAEFTIRELSLHGEAVFNLWFPRIMSYFDGEWTPTNQSWKLVFHDVCHSEGLC